MNKDIASPKRPNSCDMWLFNEIAADNPDKRYKPRRKSMYVQTRFRFMGRTARDCRTESCTAAAMSPHPESEATNA